MTKNYEEKATEEMRKMTHEEMMEIDPNKYDGLVERVNFKYECDGYENIPIPILETENDDFILEYIRQWYESEATDSYLSY